MTLGNSISTVKFMRKTYFIYSYYNWENQICCNNNTPNFQLITTHLEGILFKSKRDRKIIIVDPKAPTHGDNTVRKEIHSDKYIQVIVYRHSTRRKT